MVDSKFERSADGLSDGPERAKAEPPPRFIISPEDVRDGYVRLGGPEGHHARNVRRLGRGDDFVAIDGRGAEYEAVVEIRTADGLLGKIVRTTRRSRESLARVTLAQAVAKPPALATVVNLATPLGVSEFLLFRCARTLDRDVPPRELRHLEGVATAAVKQSLRSIVPNVTGPRDFADVVKYGHGFDVAFLCTPDPTAEPLAGIVGRGKPKPSRFLVAVGPEGGFTTEEKERAIDAGFRALDLGPRRLRTEWAGPTACAVLFYAVGDLGPTRRERR